MSDNWDFYFCRVNDALASVFVDLGLRGGAPDPNRPHLLWVWVPMRTPRDDGLSSAEESPTLRAIEDALAPALSTSLDAVLVGRITGARRREFYFYAPSSAGLGEAVRGVFAAFPEYTCEWGVQADATWQHYLEVLYPSPREHHRMLNRRTLEAFAKHGDDLSLARPVTHWLYFAQAADRALAAHELARAGFAIELLSPLEDDAGLQFGLCLERVDRIDQESIDTVVFDILDVVEGYEAEYDGWEAPVETGPGSAGPSDATAEEA